MAEAVWPHSGVQAAPRLKDRGSEKNKRKALARISELIDNPEFTSRFIKSKFLSHEVEFVKSEIRSLQRRHSLYFTDETFENLLLHTLLMIRRIKMKQPITISPGEIDAVKKKKEFQWTFACLKRLEAVFAIRFPEEEAVYLTLHILGGKVRYPFGKEGNSGLENPLLPKVVGSLINRVSELKMMDFREDRVLINGLKVHLNTVLNRLSYDLSYQFRCSMISKKCTLICFILSLMLLKTSTKRFHFRFPRKKPPI